MMNFRHARRALILAMVGLFATGAYADNPKELKLDYATYSPTSLVVRKMGWMEEEFKKDNIPVKWVLSQGSANALDYLKKGSVDFGSSAGLAAVLARASGSTIKSVYVFSKPEWTALLVAKGSSINSVKDLKGKKIAATPGTDPYIFVLRSLELNGMTKADVQMVPMAHVLGRKALESNEVDAWGGLDPHLAASTLEAGSKIIYHNPDFCSFGMLNTTEAFATAYPDAVKRVIKVYEKARAWVIANPDQTVKLMSDEAKISADVAKVQLKRNDFSAPIPGADQVKVLKAGVPTLVAEGLLPSAAAGNKAIDELIDGSFAKAAK